MIKDIHLELATILMWFRDDEEPTEIIAPKSEIVQLCKRNLRLPADDIEKELARLSARGVLKYIITGSNSYIYIDLTDLAAKAFFKA